MTCEQCSTDIEHGSCNYLYPHLLLLHQDTIIGVYLLLAAARYDQRHFDCCLSDSLGGEDRSILGFATCRTGVKPVTIGRAGGFEQAADVKRMPYSWSNTICGGVWCIRDCMRSDAKRDEQLRRDG